MKNFAARRKFDSFGKPSSRRLLPVLIIIAVCGVYSCKNRQTASEPAPSVIEQHAAPEPTRAEPTRAEQVMNALLEAYPDRIEKVEFRNDDWALLMRGIWYYYAGGRLLPENLLENAEKYRAVLFYRYPAELPAWSEQSPEGSARKKHYQKQWKQQKSKYAAAFIVFYGRSLAGA